jgi:hypothetical protein
VSVVWNSPSWPTIFTELSFSKREKLTGEWRKLHSEELNDPYCSPNINKIKKNQMGGACSAYGGEEGACTRFWWGNLRSLDKRSIQVPLCTAMHAPSTLSTCTHLSSNTTAYHRYACIPFCCLDTAAILNLLWTKPYHLQVTYPGCNLLINPLVPELFFLHFYTPCI